MMSFADLAPPIFCGLMFSVYILTMNMSKLAAPALFLLLSVITLLFALGYFFLHPESMQSVTPRGLKLGVIASIMNGVAAIVLFSFVAKSGKDEVGQLLTVMMVAQATMVGGVWPILMGGGATPSRILGALLAAIAIYLLR